MNGTLLKSTLAALLLCIVHCNLSAQNNTEQLIVDSSAVFEAAPLVDSTLTGVDVFRYLNETLGGDVSIQQSSQIGDAMARHIQENGERKIIGYRVRIFFDNSQSARTRSEAVARDFAAQYPHIKVYRSHVNPYFKVTVGDFRTKDDAQKFAGSISDRYPTVFLVKEPIHYPDI